MGGGGGGGKGSLAPSMEPYAWNMTKGCLQPKQKLTNILVCLLLPSQRISEANLH